MANELTMAIVEAIQQLQTLHWSARRIAQHLGIDRGTVGKYLKRATSGSKPAIPPPGSLGSKPATYPPMPGTSGGDDNPADSAASRPDSKPAISPAGSAAGNGCLSEGIEGDPAAVLATGGRQPTSCGRRSECEPFQEFILAKLEQGLSAQRIYQDLVEERSFAGSYDSVKRFVRRLGRSHSLPMRRMECAAGEEAQVDFGTGAPVVGPEGQRRKTHVFRIVLSHSRKAYSEVTFRQTTEDFVGGCSYRMMFTGG